MRLPARRGSARFLVCASLILAFAKAFSPGPAEAGGRERGAGAVQDNVNKVLKLKASRLTHVRVDPPAGQPFQVIVPIDGQPVTLELQPATVRGSKYQVLVQQADGSLAPADSGRERNYRGHILEIAGSAVSATLNDDGLAARILLPDGREYWIEPAARKVPEAAAGTHVVYESQDLEGGETCGTTDQHVDPQGLDLDQRFAQTTACGTGLCLAQLACDADVEFYNAFGSVAAVEERINTIVNAVNVQYERDVDITHEITTIIVRAVEPDPYTSTAPETLLNQFRNHWQSNHGGIQRDAAHLFTGKNLDGSTIGIAWLNAVCGSYGYGVAQSNFTSNFAYVSDLSAHELGHNWGTGHCSCPSYTMNPSITGANAFDPVDSIPDIETFRDTRTCLQGVSGCVDSSDCDDNSVCTGAEDCVAGSCQAGTALNCNDGNACTTDSCNAATGCAHSPVNCNDNSACTTDSCSPATGCVNTAINCNDGNACTADACNPATGCAYSSINCSDNNACTTDSCSPATGCVNTAISCNDNNACTTDSCSAANGCAHTLVNCNDGNACTADTCSAATGCVNTAINCNDNSACTTDSCSAATGCVNTAINCNDNNACTTDSCSAATGCAHAAVNCNDANACTTDSCNPASGCLHVDVTCPAGQECSGGSCVPQLCNNDGTCNGQEDCGNCPADCPADDGAACGNAVCEPAAGEDCLSCAVDCRGKQGGNPSQRFCCGDGAGQNPVGCSDPRCTAGDWACSSAPPSAYCCGDAACDPGEDSCICALDCGPAPAAEGDCSDALDNDCDGAADCQDADCAASAACLCDGDGACEPGEDCANCPADCFTGGAACGNDVCEAGDGEDCLSCPADCNGRQSGKPAQRYCCGDGAGQNPLGCSDPRCTANGNSCTSIPGAASCCGDGVCEGAENGSNCAVDCL